MLPAGRPQDHFADPSRLRQSQSEHPFTEVGKLPALHEKHALTRDLASREDYVTTRYNQRGQRLVADLLHGRHIAVAIVLEKRVEAKVARVHLEVEIDADGLAEEAEELHVVLSNPM